MLFSTIHFNFRQSSVTPLTNVYNVSVRIDHNVSVVTVLDLQQITNDRIGCHRLHEITSSRLELFRTFVAVLMQEVFVQSRVGLSSQLITRFSIGNAFDYAALDMGLECASAQTNKGEKMDRKKVTPGAVATTRYGNRNISSPTCWKIFLKIVITCRASMSCRTSSPTLNIAACQHSTPNESTGCSTDDCKGQR